MKIQIGDVRPATMAHVVGRLGKLGLNGLFDVMSSGAHGGAIDGISTSDPEVAKLALGIIRYREEGK